MTCSPSCGFIAHLVRVLHLYQRYHTIDSRRSLNVTYIDINGPTKNDLLSQLWLHSSVGKSATSAPQGSHIWLQMKPKRCLHTLWKLFIVLSVLSPLFNLPSLYQSFQSKTSQFIPKKHQLNSFNKTLKNNNGKIICNYVLLCG